MKWITTVVAALVLTINSCAEGHDDINFVSDQEDAEGNTRQYTQQQIKPSMSKNKEVIADSSSSPLLIKKDEKSESIDVLSNDEENIASVDDTQDQDFC